MRPGIASMLSFLTISVVSAAEIDVPEGWTLMDDVTEKEVKLQDADPDLSSWKDVKCWELDPTTIVGMVTVFREPKGNLDKFIAKMSVECQTVRFNPHVVAPPPQSGVSTVHLTPPLSRELFHGEYLKDASDLNMTSYYQIAAGFRLLTNPGRDYVKSLRFLTVKSQDNGMLGKYANPGEGYWGPYDNHSDDHQQDLLCPDQKVLVGVGVRYDTSKSKIRMMRIFCRTLRKVTD